MVKTMIWGTALVTSLLAAGAQASVGAMGELAPRSDMLDARMDDPALSMLEARQNGAVNLPQSSPAPAGVDMAKWDSETIKLCTDSLAQLNAASNPAGAAVCYNLMSLDTKAGSFMADLRLFQVSSASGTFAGIPPERIQVGLQYRGASVSPLSANKTAAAPQPASSGVAKRADAARQLQQYLLVGQIDKNEMNQPMTMGLLEALVLPQVTLNAVNAGGTTVSTNISSNEAAFVNGVFSKEVIMSETSRAQAAVNDMKAGLANGTVAFVLPGVSLMIFPVGLVITGLWTVLGFAAYGYGTYNRINYRHTFRTRSMMAGKGVQKTI